jgi:RecA-family ATPase
MTQDATDPLVARLQSAEAYAVGQMNGVDLEQPVDLGLVLGADRDPGPEPDFVREEIDGKRAGENGPAREVNVPQLLDLAELSIRAPQRPKFIDETACWYPQGEVTLLAAHGGTFKSSTAQHRDACIALERLWHGIRMKRRRVAFFSFEDCADVLHWRLSRICRSIGVDMRELDGWLHVFDGTRSDAIMFGDGRDGIGLTSTYFWMQEQIERCGAQCITIDGTADTFASNENSRPHVKAFVRAIRNLIPADGAATLIAHVDKLTAKSRETSEGYSGSTAWHNSVRSRWYLRPENDASDPDAAAAQADGRLILELQKSNYGPSGATIALRWNPELELYVQDVSHATASGLMARLDEDSALAALIRRAYDGGDPVPTAFGGQRTAISVLQAIPDLPAAYRGRSGARRLRAKLEALRQSGTIAAASFQRPNRHTVEVFRA